MQKQLQKFLKCDKRIHCKMCRNLIDGLSFRLSITKRLSVPIDINWICPFGIAWGEKPNQIMPKKCKYVGKRVTEVLPNRPCLGYEIQCLHPDSNIDFQREGFCTAKKCKFFVS